MIEVVYSIGAKRETDGGETWVLKWSMNWPPPQVSFHIPLFQTLTLLFISLWVNLLIPPGPIGRHSRVPNYDGGPAGIFRSVSLPASWVAFNYSVSDSFSCPLSEGIGIVNLQRKTRSAELLMPDSGKPLIWHLTQLVYLTQVPSDRWGYRSEELRRAHDIFGPHLVGTMRSTTHRASAGRGWSFQENEKCWR